MNDPIDGMQFVDWSRVDRWIVRIVVLDCSWKPAGCFPPCKLPKACPARVWRVFTPKTPQFLLGWTNQLIRRNLFTDPEKVVHLSGSLRSIVPCSQQDASPDGSFQRLVQSASVLKNYLFVLGYYDPGNVFLDKEKTYFQGDLTNITSKNEPLCLNCQK